MTRPAPTATVPDFQHYRRSQIAHLRPYIEGETLSDRVSISAADLDAGSPKRGDMIARNPANHDDQWLVAADYFAANFEPAAPAAPQAAGVGEDVNRAFACVDQVAKGAQVSEVYGGEWCLDPAIEFRAHLTTILTALRAPSREPEGGVARQAVIDFDVEEYVDGYEFRGDEGGYTPTEDERALITDAIHGVLSELSLSTREEAPAEAGSFEERAIALVKKFGSPNGSDYEQGQNDMGHRMVTMAREADAALLAQPQARSSAPTAREDAQPVAYEIVSYETYSGAVWVSPDKADEYRTKYGCVLRPLYTHPAPDALRVAVEALEKIKRGDVTVFDDDLQCEVEVTMDGEEAAEIADQALAALQAEQGAK